VRGTARHKSVRLEDLVLSESLLRRNPGVRALLRPASLPEVREESPLWVGKPPRVEVTRLPEGVSVFYPGLRLASVANLRDHWLTRHRRVKAERGRVTAGLLGCPRPKTERLRVLLERQGPRRWDDDNNTMSLKAVRDAVAAWLGIDDGDSRVRYEALQRQTPRAWGVRITFVEG